MNITTETTLTLPPIATADGVTGDACRPVVERFAAWQNAVQRLADDTAPATAADITREHQLYTELAASGVTFTYFTWITVRKLRAFAIAALPIT